MCNTVKLCLKQRPRESRFFLKPISILALNHRTSGGGGVLPYINHIGMCRPKGWGFCTILVWKRVYTLSILVWNLVWFSRELRECLNLFIVYRKKDKYANSKWMLRNSFCCCSNLSNNGIIFQRPGLKTGVQNDIFWSEIGSGFGEPGDRPPPRILRSTPSPGTYLVLRTFVFWNRWF